MNIMILVVSYPPIIDSAARLYSELSESLGEMKHSVTVISEHPAEDSPVDKSHEYYGNRFSRIDSNGVNVLRVSPLSILSRIPGGKPIRFLLSCILFTFRGIFTSSPDVILVYSPPLYMGIAGYILSKAKKSRFVFNMQDIHPKVLFDSGAVRNQLIKRILSRMEDICYRKAYSFIVYSSGNRGYLLKRGVDREVFIIPNWVDTTARALSDHGNAFRHDKLIENKFVVSYAGTMQGAQGLEIVVEAADALKEYNDIIFLLAGEGSSKSALNSLINERKVTNVLLRPVMPKDRYIQFLYASDVCLIALSSDIPLQTVPGKLADIMACGRPVIAVVNQLGDAASIIREAGCGFSVDPGDTEAFSQAVLRLRNDKGLRKQMGDKARLFAEQNFSRAVCTKRYEEVLCHAARGDRFQQI
jgi:glycosyltransferase involved in cell wall biosynthesis